MAKKLKDVSIDQIGFNATHWGSKSLEEFTKEAMKEGAAMIPQEIAEKDRAEWLKTAHEWLVKAANGDDTARPSINTEDLKEELAAAKEKKAKVPTPDKPAKPTT